jgi:hypothetical protein
MGFDSTRPIADKRSRPTHEPVSTSSNLHRQISEQRSTCLPPPPARNGGGAGQAAAVAITGAPQPHAHMLSSQFPSATRSRDISELDEGLLTAYGSEGSPDHVEGWFHHAAMLQWVIWSSAPDATGSPMPRKVSEGTGEHPQGVWRPRRRTSSQDRDWPWRMLYDGEEFLVTQSVYTPGAATNMTLDTRRGSQSRLLAPNGYTRMNPWRRRAQIGTRRPPGFFNFPGSTRISRWGRVCWAVYKYSGRTSPTGSFLARESRKARRGSRQTPSSSQLRLGEEEDRADKVTPRVSGSTGQERYGARTWPDGPAPQWPREETTCVRATLTELARKS